MANTGQKPHQALAIFNPLAFHTVCTQSILAPIVRMVLLQEKNHFKPPCGYRIVLIEFKLYSRWGEGCGCHTVEKTTLRTEQRAFRQLGETLSYCWLSVDLPLLPGSLFYIL
jgi:hypothetical protein